MIAASLATAFYAKFLYAAPFLGAIPGILRDISANKQLIETIISIKDSHQEQEAERLKAIQLCEARKDFLVACLIGNVLSVAILVSAVAFAVISKYVLLLAVALVALGGFQAFQIYSSNKMIASLTPTPTD